MSWFEKDLISDKDGHKVVCFHQPIHPTLKFHQYLRCSFISIKLVSRWFDDITHWKINEPIISHILSNKFKNLHYKTRVVLSGHFRLFPFPLVFVKYRYLNWQTYICFLDATMVYNTLPWEFLKFKCWKYFLYLADFFLKKCMTWSRMTTS